MSLFTNLFTTMSRLLVFLVGFTNGSDTRLQWKESGLLENMKSKMFLCILGFMQMCNSCSLIAETLVWLTVRVFGQFELHVIGDYKFTMQGVDFANEITVFALVGWLLAMFISEVQFQKTCTYPSIGPFIPILNTLFWILSATIGVRVFLNSNKLDFLAFCALRIVTFSQISQENPGWHLLAYFALCLVGNPLRSTGYLPLITSFN